MTMGGVILGTAAYMSPEQAKGKAVDKRTDIWAFGCVLFEMLTGRRAFEAEDVSETLAAVLRANPTGLRSVPCRLRVVEVVKALSRERSKRRIARYRRRAVRARAATGRGSGRESQPSEWTID